MRVLLRSLLTAAVLGLTAAACAPGGAQCPAYLRQDLATNWLRCTAGSADIAWPPNQGYAAVPAPAPKLVYEGAEVDRFGFETGTFFSPAGASFKARAVPYVCNQMEYRVYRVMKPMVVQSGVAAPWFAEPGGAIQYMTADSAADLRKAGVLKVVKEYHPGGTEPAPQCEQ